MSAEKKNKIINQLLKAATARDSQNGHDIEWIRKQYDVSTEEGVKNLLK
ncbi:MAG: hypothetical protein J5965_05185 [Aeriscardovia sp.]|nr:hypothetical protein [Aeriscardovia sp.]